MARPPTLDLELHGLMEDRLTKMLNHLEALKKPYRVGDPRERGWQDVVRGEFTEIDKNFQEFQMLRSAYLLVRGIRP